MVFHQPDPIRQPINIIHQPFMVVILHHPKNNAIPKNQALLGMVYGIGLIDLPSTQNPTSHPLVASGHILTFRPFES